MTGRSHEAVALAIILKFGRGNTVVLKQFLTFKWVQFKCHIYIYIYIYMYIWLNYVKEYKNEVSYIPYKLFESVFKVSHILLVMLSYIYIYIYGWTMYKNKMSDTLQVVSICVYMNEVSCLLLYHNWCWTLSAGCVIKLIFCWTLSEMSQYFTSYLNMCRT